MHADLATRAESLLQDAQELVDTLTRLVDRLQVLEAVQSLPDAGKRRAPWRKMLERTATEHGLTVPLMLTGKRAFAVAARRDAYAALRAAGYSYPEIGRFCGRDHSTVMHALGVR
jgi:chromosomal replication initiation ATPase DnaA